MTLRAAVAVELSQTFEDLIDTSGLYAADPVARIAAGCAVFIGEAQRDPAWGALIARGACAVPTFASAARECLKTNLRLAQSEGRVASFSIEVGFDLVFGINWVSPSLPRCPGVAGTRWLDDGVVGRGSNGEGLLGEAMKEQPAGI